MIVQFRGVTRKSATVNSGTFSRWTLEWALTRHIDTLDVTKSNDTYDTGGECPGAGVSGWKEQALNTVLHQRDAKEEAYY